MCSPQWRSEGKPSHAVVSFPSLFSLTFCFSLFFWGGKLCLAAPAAFVFLLCVDFSSALTGSCNLSVLTMLWTLRIWKKTKKNPKKQTKPTVLWCERKRKELIRVAVYFIHNDWGEQKWAQRRKREGPGETAPAAGVRPQWTFKDWAGLCWDAGVPLGELFFFLSPWTTDTKLHLHTRVSESLPEGRANKQTNKQTQPCSLFSMHGASIHCDTLITCGAPTTVRCLTRGSNIFQSVASSGPRY